MPRCPLISAPCPCPCTPLLRQWFMSFYEHRDTVGYTPKECILKEGELLFIPVSGGVPPWLHASRRCSRLKLVKLSVGLAAPPVLVRLLRPIESIAEASARTAFGKPVVMTTAPPLQPAVLKPAARAGRSASRRTRTCPAPAAPPRPPAAQLVARGPQP